MGKKNKIKLCLNKIKKNKFFKIGKRLITLRGINHFAPSSLTFFMLLSFIPCLTIVELILSFINVSLEESISIFDFIFLKNNDLSISIKNIFLNIDNLNYFSISFGSIFTIYLASKGLTYFSFQVKQMYNYTDENTQFIKRKIITILFTLLITLVLSFLIVFLIIFDRFLLTESNVFFNFLKYVLILFVLFVFILVLYVVAIGKKGKFKEVIWGSIFSSLGIGIGIFIYYIYLTNFSTSLTLYGPLSIFALICLVTYYSSYILFIGVEINIMIKEKGE